MAENEVSIFIKVEGEDAQNAINSFSKSTQSAFASIENKIDSVSQKSRRFEELAIDGFGQIKFAAIGLATTFSEIAESQEIFGKGLLATAKFLDTNTKAIFAAEANLQSFLSGVSKSTSGISSFSKIILDGNTGLSKAAVGFASISTALGAYATIARDSESSTIRLTASLAAAGAVLAGGVSVGFGLALSKIGSFVTLVGEKLVDVNQKATDSFLELDKQTFIFTRTVENFDKALNGSVGSVDVYQSKIDEISKSTGANLKDLQGAASELIAALSPLGFSQEQILKLLEVSTDYAAQIHNEIIPTTIDFVQALNGSAQGAVKYGVKLFDANVQQHLFSEGLDVNFDKLSSQQKAQVRYNQLLEKYIPVAGIAADVTKTLAGQQDLLNSRLKNAEQGFGKGAALIENLQIKAFALNQLLPNLSENFLATTGFISAVGARILEASGYLIKFSIEIVVATKLLKLFQIAAESQALQNLATRQIPLLNLSLIDLTKSLGLSKNSLTSWSQFLGDITKGIASTIKGPVDALLGLQGTTTSVFGYIVATVTRAGEVIASVLAFVGKSFLTLLKNPIVLAIAAVTAAIYTVIEAFSSIEKSTGAVSKLWNVFLDILKQTSPIFDVIIAGIKEVGAFFSNIFGRIVDGLSLVLIKLTEIGTTGFGSSFVSEKNKKALADVASTLTNFREELSSVDFQLTKLKKQGQTSIIDTQIIEASYESIKKLKEELKNVGITDFEIAKTQYNERIKLVNDAINAGIIAEKEASNLKIAIAQDLNAKIQKITEERGKKEQEILEKAAKEAKDLRDKQDAEFSKTAGLATGFTANVLQGRQGAVSAVSTVAELAGQAVGIPGLGQVAGLLSAGPEQTKAMVKAFIEALPDIIQAISESIPVIVETFVDVMVNKGGAVKIGIAIVKAMVGVPLWASIGKQIFGKSGDEIAKTITESAKEYGKQTQDSFTQAFYNFGPALQQAGESFYVSVNESIKRLPAIFQSEWVSGAKQFFADFGAFIEVIPRAIYEAVVQAFNMFGGFFVSLIRDTIISPLQSIFNPLIDALNKLKAAVEKAGTLGGKGGGEGVFKETLKRWGFSKGGIVPAYAADGMFVPRGTDTVPAMLTPGEMVIPRDMVGELGAFLSATNQGTGGTDQAMLAAILAAVQAPMTVTAEAKVNQSAFADIILQLNRQNARLSA